MSKLHHVTSKPETSNSESRRAADNERDDDDVEEQQAVRTNLLHQFSVQVSEDADQGHDLDEQATKVDRRRERFSVAHLKELFEKKLGAKHFNYGQATASIVKFVLRSLCLLDDRLFNLGNVVISCQPIQMIHFTSSISRTTRVSISNGCIFSVGFVRSTP